MFVHLLQISLHLTGQDVFISRSAVHFQSSNPSRGQYTLVESQICRNTTPGGSLGCCRGVGARVARWGGVCYRTVKVCPLVSARPRRNHWLTLLLCRSQKCMSSFWVAIRLPKCWQQGQLVTSCRIHFRMLYRDCHSREYLSVPPDGDLGNGMPRWTYGNVHNKNLSTKEVLAVSSTPSAVQIRRVNLFSLLATFSCFSCAFVHFLRSSHPRPS